MNENAGGRVKGVQREIVRLARTCRTREKWASMSLALMLMVLGGQAGVAEVVPASPNLINYQGTLYLASDPITPVTGYQNLEFSLYPTADGEVPLWAEMHQDVHVANGEFSVFLGVGEEIEGTPHDLLEKVFQTRPLWLGVKVGLDAELPQRQLITSVPYALTATSVTTATHGVPPGTIVMFAGPAPPAGWLTCDGTGYDGSLPEYAALHAAIGNTWGGSGDAFNVPNFMGRTPIGKTAATAADQNFGVNATTVTLFEKHLPSHAHEYDDTSIFFPYFFGMATGGYYAADNPQPLVPAPTPLANTPAGGSHNNVQPSTYIFFIIKL